MSACVCDSMGCVGDHALANLSGLDLEGRIAGGLGFFRSLLEPLCKCVIAFAWARHRERLARREFYCIVWPRGRERMQMGSCTDGCRLWGFHIVRGIFKGSVVVRAPKEKSISLQCVRVYARAGGHVRVRACTHVHVCACMCMCMCVPLPARACVLPACCASAHMFCGMYLWQRRYILLVQ
jgi:hypothetical protein